MTAAALLEPHQTPLPEFDPRAERRHRIVRPASRTQYAVLRDQPGLRSKRTGDVLRSIAAMYNRWQIWPTRGELAEYMHARGHLPRPDPSLIAPRLTELSRGIMNRATRQYDGGGDIEALPPRPCRFAQTPAHPWRIRQRGSLPLLGDR